MDTFFSFLKKGLVATLFVIFGFVATYIPQPFNQINTVEAGAATGKATVFEQISAKVEQIGTNIATTASAAYDAITSYSTEQNWIKEGYLDGIGWVLAKKIVSSMVQSLVDWINSGFNGSPAFVQDLGGFLTNAADEAIGEYISKLGSVGSFICSPFRLDVQISVQLAYDVSRRGDPAPKCSLSNIVDNFEQFLAGDFSQGGWTNWFEITANPETLTPYGAMLTAQDGARAAIINAKGEKLAELDFGQGFLSGKICQMVNGTTGPQKKCKISKPGTVIKASLDQHLGAGLSSLIAADEINEVVGALIGQIANKAVTGASGLLGLSSGTGYTYAGYDSGSYTGQMAAQSSLVGNGSDDILTLLTDAAATQRRYNNLANQYGPLLQAYSTNPAANEQKRPRAASAYQDTLEVIAKTNLDISLIGNMTSPTTGTGLIGDLLAAQAANDSIKESEVISSFTNLRVYNEGDVNSSEKVWAAILR